MSRIILDLNELGELAENTLTESFLRLRIFAQFHGVDINNKSKSSEDIYLRFSNIPGIQKNASGSELYQLLIDEAKYGEVFVNGKGAIVPHDGDILDLRCFYDACSKKIEILHLRHITLSELDVLINFVSSDDPLIREFLK